MQAKKHDGYSTQTQRKLDRLSEGVSKGKISNQDNTTILKESNVLEIKIGTKLLREYKGEKHEVFALDKGFNYKNKFYKSLSGIANEITGTRWNGKVFFGIKK